MLPAPIRGAVGVVYFTYIALNGILGALLIAVSYICLRPLSRSTFLKAACAIQSSFLMQLVWYMEKYLGIELRISGEMPRTEAALVIANHQSHDWVHMYCMALRINTLGLVRTVIKKVISYAPGLGWAMYLSYWPFVSRDFKKDEAVLKALFAVYRETNLPVQLWLYPEGTRMTPKKLADSQEYAKKSGYPVWDHVMLPRHRGFAVAANSLVGVCDVVHELTLAYEGWGALAPSLWELLTTDSRKHNCFHVHCQRTPMSVIPADDDGKKTWLMECFQRKEDKLAHYHKNGNTFPGKKLNADVSTAAMVPHLVIWAVYFAVMVKLVIIG